MRINLRISPGIISEQAKQQKGRPFGLGGAGFSQVNDPDVPRAAVLGSGVAGSSFNKPTGDLEVDF